MNDKKPYILKKESLISDILYDCPKAIELLTEYGLRCASCYLNQSDTLEKGSKLHNFNNKKLKKMIIEINTELEKEENWV